MLIIGLTGGIGCGKTTVTELFIKRNVPVIDADVIAHAVVQPGQLGLTLLEQSFGGQILLADSSLNRTHLRELVFNNPQQKEILEGILHPIIYNKMHEDLGHFNSPYCILSIPLLIETNHQEKLDRILVIDCPEDIQIKRVKARDQLSDSMIESIMQSQCSRATRLKHADDTLSNNGSLLDLDSKVEKLHNFYMEMSAGKIK